MPSGLVAHWDALELAVSGASSYSASGAPKDHLWSAGVLTRHALSFGSPTTFGIVIGVESYEQRVAGPTPTSHSYTFEIPDAGISSTAGGASYKASMSASAVLSGVRLYCTGTDWLLRVDGWDFFVEGALHASGGAFVLASDWLAPVATPLLGLAPALTCMAGQNPAPVRTALGVFDPALTYEHVAEASASGGWRFRPAGSASWQTPQVVPGAVPAYSGCPHAPPRATATASTTWDAQVTAYSRGNDVVSTSAARRVFDLRNASISLTPVLERSVRRVEPASYRALWYRAAIPYAHAVASGVCVDLVPPPGEPFDPPYEGAETLVRQEVSQHYSEFLEEVSGPGPAVIEEPLSAALWSPTAFSNVFWDVRNVPDNGPGRYWKEFDGAASYPIVSDDPDTDALITVLQPAFGEPAPELVAWYNQVASPHWLIFFWYPAQTGAGHQWTVDGAPELPEDYWLPWRGQWMSHPALPGGGTKRRTNVVAEGLFHSPLSPTVKAAYFGNCETGWVGVRRFRRLAYTPRTPYTYTAASSSLWSASNATLSFGATSVTATSIAAGACEVDLDLRSFAVEPYLLAQVARGFVADWSEGSGISGTAAYLVSYDGSETLLASTPSAFERRRPLGEDSTYVGSWRQDFGQGEAADQGYDDKAEGRSDQAFYGPDPARAHHYMLLAGRGARYLRFKFTAASAGGTLQIRYPTLFLP